jgi:putative endonuclease
MAYVYILKSLSCGKFYIGSTANIEERMRHHKGGFTPSTKRLGEIDLIFKQRYDSLKDARYIEGKLKKLKKRLY